MHCYKKPTPCRRCCTTQFAYSSNAFRREVTGASTLHGSQQLSTPECTSHPPPSAYTALFLCLLFSLSVAFVPFFPAFLTCFVFALCIHVSSDFLGPHQVWRVIHVWASFRAVCDATTPASHRQKNRDQAGATKQVTPFDFSNKSVL